MFPGSNWQLDNIGPGNGLAHVRRQDIIWADDDLVLWHIHTSVGLNEFRQFAT